jgi:hypothetical protein
VSLGAQAKTVSSPPGFETAGQTPEDRTWGYYLGQYADERLQAVDGQFRQRLMLITEVSYRLDQRNYAANATSAGVGRTWSNVTLAMSGSDYDRFGATFSTNGSNTPTRVFSGSMTWADMIGMPIADPAPWGSHGHAFPFTSPWFHAGTEDILFDYVFTGGTLANSATWGGTTSVRYYLDGYYSAYFALGAQVDHPPSPGQTNPPFCMDSAFSSSTNAARNDIQGIFLYNGDHPSRPDEVYLQWRSFNTAPSAPVINALAFAGLPTGVAIGAACNSLYLDTTMPHILIPQTAASSGTSPFITLGARFVPSMGGLSLWFQSAWADSATSRFSLTTATERTVPSSIPPRGPRRQTLYSSDPNAVSGNGPHLNGTSWAANPMYRITYN